MAESILGSTRDLLKKINSVSFIEWRDDEGKTVLFIPAWVVIALIALSIFLRRVRR